MGVRDLRVKPISTGAGGAVIFELPLTTRASITGEYKLFLSSTGALIFDNGSTQTTIGAAGAAGIPNWESIFTADSTFTITPDVTFTIAGNRSTATDVLTLSNSAGGSGSVLQFSNSGSGNDVDGTSNTWSVSKAGAATFLTVALSGTTMTSTDNIAWTLKDNSATALVIGSTGSTAIITVDTSDAAPIVKFGNSVSLTDGNATFISTSNTVTNVLVTNNTLTTFGANANSAGMVCLRSTSLTTGSLLQLQLSDTANNGGFYLNCRESVGGTNDFTIGENGVLTMAGTAASDSLTMTAGDMVLSDGSITITDADNAATFSLTNNTATSATVFVLAGSGVFTGTTTTSFMTLTASGLTTGTVLYVPAAALTQGKVVDIQATAATDGILVNVAGGGANITATGRMLKLAMGAATVGQAIEISTSGVYTGASLIGVTANSMTTGVGVLLTSTATGMTSGSLLRISTGTTGAVATSGIVSITATADYSSTSNVGLLNVAAASTTAGTIVNIKGGALTTGVALNVADAGTGMTSGSLLRITTATTSAVATNGVVSITASADFTSTASCGLVQVVADSLTAGVLHNMSVAALTTGTAFRITNGTSAMTTGRLLAVVAGGVGTIATNGIVALTHAGVYSSTANIGFVNITAGATQSGTILSLTAGALTTGVALIVSDAGTGITSGSLIRASTGTTGAVATNGVISLRATGAYTSTSRAGLLDIVADSTVAGTIVHISGAALTTGNMFFADAGTGIYTGTGLVTVTGSGVTTGTVFLLSNSGVMTSGGSVGKLLEMVAAGATTSTSVVSLTTAALTTGTAMVITANALTTGGMLTLTSSSADTSARVGIQITNSNAAANAFVPISISQSGLQNTNYRRIIKETATGITIWMGNGTTANGTLSGTAGDILINGGSNKPEYCTGTTNWTALV